MKQPHGNGRFKHNGRYLPGAPQASFIKKDGTIFTRTFFSTSTRGRAIKGYEAKGGIVATTGRLRSGHGNKVQTRFSVKRQFRKMARSY